MAVYEYEDSAGFRGCRVVRTVNTVQQQYYLPFGKRSRKAVRREAEQIDAALAEQQERYRQNRYPTATPLKGVSAMFLQSRGRYHPVFRVQVGPGGAVRSRSVSIAKYGIRGAWEEAVRFWADARGQKVTPALRRLCPDATQFLAIYRHMRQCGHDIPAHRLPE